MKLQNFRLRFEPDRELPALKRLAFDRTDISVEDVFLKGIHPHSAVSGHGRYEHTGMAEAILAGLNDAQAYPPELNAHGLGHEVSAPGYAFYGTDVSNDSVERLLHYLAESLYFVEDLGYDALLQMATERLRRLWSAAIAREMLGNVARDFACMREMLKAKNPDIKLAGYADLDGIDVSLLLSVDDFLTEDNLLLSKGLETLNFRCVDALKSFTDNHGRLRATDRIGQCQMTWDQGQCGTPLFSYRCIVDGLRIHWFPNMTDSAKQRNTAKEIARTWGKGSGRYCFTTDIPTLGEMVSTTPLRLGFPDLLYGGREKTESEASAQVQQKCIATFDAPFHVKAKSSNEAIKDILRRFDRKLTGRKEDLVQRLAELLAERYGAMKHEMDAFFDEHRFIRLAHDRSEAKALPVMREDPLAGHLLTMYCLRHMRGNVVLESRHENNAVGDLDLAEAILAGRVRLTGCFVPVE